MQGGRLAEILGVVGPVCHVAAERAGLALVVLEAGLELVRDACCSGVTLVAGAALAVLDAVAAAGTVRVWRALLALRSTVCGKPQILCALLY